MIYITVVAAGPQMPVKMLLQTLAVPFIYTAETAVLSDTIPLA
jgi:hypothetical protein